MRDEPNEDSDQEDGETAEDEEDKDSTEDDEEMPVGSDEEKDVHEDVDELIEEDEEEEEEGKKEWGPALQKPGKHCCPTLYAYGVETYTKLSVDEAKAKAAAQEKG